MYKVLQYLKYLGIFMLVIICIGVITSLINLTGISNNLISKISTILCAFSFFGVVASASKNTNEKGYILGVKLGLIFIISLIIINLILFKSNMSVDRIIYYIILLASGILGGSFGKNLKKKDKK